MRRVLLALLPTLLLAWAPACATRPIEGFDRLTSARIYHDSGRREEALSLSEQVLDPDVTALASPEEKEEATWIAAESAFALGEHKLAFRYYRDILENYPWSPHAVNIEDRLFEIGEAFLFEDRYDGIFFSDRTRGVEAMETLQVHFRRSGKADDALRHVAQFFASDEQREYGEAAITYELLYREYPDSEWAEDALWMSGHCRLRLAPGPQYNRDTLLKAEELLRLSLQVHPRGVRAREAEEDLVRARELLAEGAVLVANFYSGRGVPAGVRLRLANAALLYPDTVAGRLARQRLQLLGLSLSRLAAYPGLNSMDAARAQAVPWEDSVR